MNGGRRGGLARVRIGCLWARLADKKDTGWRATRGYRALRGSGRSARRSRRDRRFRDQRMPPPRRLPPPPAASRDRCWRRHRPRGLVFFHESIAPATQFKVAAEFAGLMAGGMLGEYGRLARGERRPLGHDQSSDRGSSRIVGVQVRNRDGEEFARRGRRRRPCRSKHSHVDRQ